MKKRLLLLCPLAALLLLVGCDNVSSSLLPNSESESVASNSESSAVSQSTSSSESVPASSSSASSETPIEDHTIASIQASGDYDVKGIIVLQTSKGFVLDDGTGAVYCYVALDAGFAVGDYASATLTIAPYYAIWEATAVASMTKLTETAPLLDAPVTLTPALIDEWKTKGGTKDETTAPLATADVYPVKFTAAAALDGTYSYFNIEGSTTKLEPSSLLDSMKLTVGTNYDIVAYCAGYNGSKDFVGLYVQEATAKYDTITALDIQGATSVAVGATIELKAVVTPSTANPGVVWETSDAETATVVDGIVTGVKEGNVNITATSVVDSNIKKQYTITVTAAVPTSSLAKYAFTTIPTAPSVAPYGALDTTGALAIFQEPTYLVSGTNVITSVTTSTFIYQADVTQGPKINGLKVGKSSAGGVLTFVSSSTVSKVAITVRAWGATKLASLTVNSGTAVALVAADATVDRVIEFVLGTPSTTITITSSTYCIFTGLELIGA